MDGVQAIEAKFIVRMRSLTTQFFVEPSTTYRFTREDPGLFSTAIAKFYPQKLVFQNSFVEGNAFSMVFCTFYMFSVARN
jgi:hypothetical protein